MSFKGQRRLATRFNYFPLLRLLILDDRFRWISLCLLCLVCGLFLLIPKIWRTTPKGFLPEIKVRGTDLIQEWAFKRNARKAEAAGKWQDAMECWRAAVASNEGNAAGIRACLRAAVKAPESQERDLEMIRQAQWFLKLAGTNVSDLEIACQAFERLGASAVVYNLLDPRKDSLSPELERMYLWSLFEEDRIEEFGGRWLGKKTLLNDPLLAQYYLAYEAGWGPREARPNAKARIQALCDKPESRAIGTRLRLVVAAQEGNLPSYEQSLAELEKIRANRLKDHINLWRMLAEARRLAEAKDIALKYPYPPKSAGETVDLVLAYKSLGLKDQALTLLRKYCNEFPFADRLWELYANELIAQKQWDELVRVVAQMRVKPGIEVRMAGFAYYVEGRANLGLGRRNEADLAFKKIPGAYFGDGRVATLTSHDLIALGYAEQGKEVLSRLEKTFGKDAQYWLLVFEAARECKDVDLMLKASEQAYHLLPSSPVVSNLYLASLLLDRKSPEVALKLSSEMLSKYTNSLAVRLNHGAALLRNNRPEEAVHWLQAIDTTRLPVEEKSLYNLDLFEGAILLKHYDEARRLRERIDPSFLFPAQREWFDQACRQLQGPDRSKA